jgi:ABC-type nickel/cobalt efflux system permease component RcnA
MSTRICNRSARAAAWLLALAWLVPLVGHADTVASLLGNFTINQFCGLQLEPDSVRVHYAVIYGQLPALRELHRADANGDGVTTQAERDAYVGALAPQLAEQLMLEVDGARVPLRASTWTSSLPTEQGGFSLRVDVDYVADLAAVAVGTVRHLRLRNENYPSDLGWHEIVVDAASGLAVFDTNAYDSSLTEGLTQALRALPDEGPLDERDIQLGVVEGAAPINARLIGPRPGQVRAATSTEAAPATDWIGRETRQVVDSISAPTVAPRVALLALLAAMLLGAVHALSPGHGKTIVGAYLIGSRGTPRHAAFLGITVTITHTLGVFILGFAMLYASRFIVPGRLFPILSLISALLVLGMGGILFVQRARALRPTSAFQVVKPATASMRPDLRVPYAQTYAGFDTTMHSHGGGPLHSHLPPGARGEKISWRSLFALGVSGGLVPCPSAMVILLAAVALNKTAFGMLLVVAFSVGLALTLTAVGFAFLYARNRFGAAAVSGRWAQWLPLASAVMITLVGVALSIAAVRSFAA